MPTRLRTAPRSPLSRTKATVAGLIVGALLSAIIGLSPPTTASAAPIAIATPTHRAYVVMLDDTSGVGQWRNTDAELLALVDQGLERWVVESERSISSFTRVGPTARMNVDCAAGNVFEQAWNNSANVFPGVDFSGASGNHYIAIGMRGCGSGVGTAGVDGLSSGGKVYIENAPGRGTQSLLHELGHNFGLRHSHYETCTPDGTCRDGGNESYEIMGGTISSNPPQIAASLGTTFREDLGILQPCEVADIALVAGQDSSTLTFDLRGRGQPEGLRDLRVTAPTGERYDIQWRNRQGRDAQAYYGTSLALAQENAYGPGITIQRMDTASGIPLLQGYPKPRGTGLVFAMQGGQSYSRPDDGLQVRVDSLTAGSDPAATARVTVTLSNAAGTTVLPAQTGEVAVQGAARIGSTLTADTPGWAPAACRQYQWFDDGVEIAGARDATFTVPATADAHRISVRVTGYLPGSAPRAVMSTPVLIGVPSDTAAPETTITSPAPGEPGVGISFAFSADEPATFECSMDGGDFVACASPFDVAAQDAGEHVFRVRAIDLAGNVDATPAAQTYVLADRAATPAAPVVEPSDGTSVRGRADVDMTVTVRAAEVVVGTGPVGADGSFDVALSPTQAVGTVLAVTVSDGDALVSPATTIVVGDQRGAPAPSPARVDASTRGSGSAGEEPGGLASTGGTALGIPALLALLLVGAGASVLAVRRRRAARR